MPAVDRQGQSTPNPHIIKRLPLVVWLDDRAAVPVAFLHSDLVAERTHELVAYRGWKATELDPGTVATQRIDADRLLFGIDTGKSVEIRQPLVVIIRVLYSFDRLAGLDCGELERPRAHDVLLVPAGIL